MNIFFCSRLVRIYSQTRPSQGGMSRENEIWLETRGLPGVLRTALARVGYHRPDVRVRRSETVHVGGSAAFEGNRSFAVVVNLETGEIGPVREGSWGGITPFGRDTIDHDDRQHPIPPNGAAIVGESGGRGCFAAIHVHPTNVTPALQASDATVTAREAAILACFARLKGGSYRREALGAGRVSKAEIDGLAARGLLKINKAGAGQITTAGRNAAAPREPYRQWGPGEHGLWEKHLLPDGGEG